MAWLLVFTFLDKQEDEVIWLMSDFHLHSVEAQNKQTNRQKFGFLTNFATEVPELEGPVMTSRNNACIVQQELG